MKYINKRTRAIIDINAKLKGDEWEPYKEKKKAEDDKADNAETKTDDPEE